MLTNNENFSGNLPEEEKEMYKLCLESSNVNKFFKQQSCSGEEIYLDEEIESSELNGAFKYRKWNIDDDNIGVFLRSEIDGYTTVDGENVECMVKALNEYDLGNEWRKKFQNNNKGHILTSEIKN